MRSDAEARLRALDAKTSFLVQAPAGSGKTELLIQRYLRLLETVDAPQSVVALTFTKKAAAEMRARVVEALRRAAAGERPEKTHQITTHEIALRVLAQDERLGWQLLANPGQIRMETIDALCASITRQMPWLSRFGAYPEVTEKPQPLFREAAHNTLRILADEEKRGEMGPVSRLLLHLDNKFERAAKLIAEMLERREQWLGLLGAGPGGDGPKMRRELERRLQKLIEAHLQYVVRCIGENREDVCRGAGLKELPTMWIESLPRWQELADKVLVKNRGDYRQVFLRQRMHLQNDDELREALADCRKLPEPCYSDEQWEATEAILRVLPVAVVELQNVFAERGVVDFAELSLRASEALGALQDPSDLALALGYRIQHLLIDEFQDISFSQYTLFSKLTAGWDEGDGRTLFLVGDPMQSIYRFRQAEVSLFLQAKEHGIGSVRLESLSLKTNFRAAPRLVDWVNQACATAFPKQHDVERGAIAYTRFETGRAAEEEAVVACHAFWNQADEAKHCLALLGDAPGSDTALLVRSRTHLLQTVKLLRENSVPFQAIEIDALCDRPVIQDLMALLFALLHAADRISWLAVLRAPWCGLTLEDLTALTAGDAGTPVSELLVMHASDLSEDGRERVARIRPVLDYALAHRGRSGLRDWVEETWQRLGGAAWAEKNDLEDAAAFFDLLEASQEGADLADFEGFRGDVGTLFAKPDAGAQDRLQVMTIHKAKGLEFDRVIVLGMGQAAKVDDNALLRWHEREGELLLATIPAAGPDADPIYKFLSRLDRTKTRSETCRLIYVALTRARKHLHLLGCVTCNARGEVSHKSDTFLKVLWPAVHQQFQPGPAAVFEAGERRVRKVRRLATGERLPMPPAGVPWAAGEEELAARDVTYEWVGDTLRHIGTAVHIFLQKMATEGLERWDVERVKSMRRTYAGVLANLGVTPQELEDAAERVESGLLRILADERGRWLLSGHAQAACEYPLSGRVGGQLFQGVIDRTFVDARGVRWIVDYKTSEHQGGSLENFFAEQMRRYRPQLETYARLMQRQEPRPVKLALYFPLLTAWREWDAPGLAMKQGELFE